MTVAAATAVAALSACTVGPDYVRPDERLPVALTAGAAPAAPALDVPAEWWALFHSPTLNKLVEDALTSNPGIEVAQANLRAAREAVAAQRGAYFPSAAVSLSSTRQKTPNSVASPASSGSNTLSLNTAQVSVSYTLDVFGLNRRMVESLEAQARNQEFELQATDMALTSNIVTAAIGAAATREEIEATQVIIERQTRLLHTLQREFDLGQVASADVALAEAALANTEATLPPLQKQLALDHDLITALGGRFPADAAPLQAGLAELSLTGDLPSTLPSLLVEHRPDVRAAEEAMHAASAQIGVAVANRLPSITLGLDTYGSAAQTLAKLFHSGTGFWNLAAGASEPVFDGGTLKHREGQARAEYDAAAAQYRLTVINAFQNVADSLEAIHADEAELAAAKRAEHASARSLAIAQRQLELGDISPTTVWGIEQTARQAEISRIQAEATRLQDAVALFVALGGGWWNRPAGDSLRPGSAKKS